MLLSLFMFPKSASTFASQVDHLYAFLVVMSLVISLGIAGTVAMFAIRYRRRSEDQVSEDIHGSLALEIIWSAIPFAIAMFIFYWAAGIFFTMSRPPDNAMEIFVVGKQWMWKIQHMEGRREINTLHVPVGRAVKLTMTSEDVIHSFYVPAFRVKGDVVPGRYNTMWFEATKTGSYHLFCAEYCGTEHSRMIGQVVVMEPAAYQRWLTDETPASRAGQAAGIAPAERGAQVFEEQACATCHIDEPGGIGPKLSGAYGEMIELDSGEKVKFDDAYIRESILDPTAKMAMDFPPLMPVFAGKIGEEDIMALIAYIKSLPSDSAAEGQAQQEQTK